MANKAIFLDRDDTLIEDPGYINDPDQVKLLEGVPEAMNTLRAMGYKLVVVSNQSAVARGIVTEEVLGQIHKRLEQLLAEERTSLDGIYYCPYHPDGAIPKYRKDSDHRKPNPGMLLDAARDMDIDLKQSWMVGNSPGDVEAGARAGCRTILLDSRGHEQKIRPGERAPDYRAVNLKEVVNIIKMHARSAQKPLTITAPVVQPAPQAIEEPQRQSEARQEAEPPQQPPPRPTSGRVEAGEPEQPPPQQTGEQPSAASSARLAEDGESRRVEPTTKKTDELLTDILEQLKNTRRSGMFAESEFSILRFLAGVIQMAVPFCLLISLWFLIGPDKKTDHILISLGFAAVLQIMALTLYTMQGPK
jgi:D,D-heptose 1,7-bisphosphate phosphatase